MNRQRTISFGIIVLLFVGGALWFLSTETSKQIAMPAPQPNESSHPAPVPRRSPSSTAPGGSTAVVSPPKTSDIATLREWWVEMRKRDKNFDWKLPIEFYGKVVDDQGQAVQGAAIQFMWTDMSSKGTSTQTTQSDGGGLFSLTGVKGKNLGVKVSKEGYRHYFDGNQFTFEYASYDDPTFYQPDSTGPVVFKLHKNREAEPLVFKNQESKIQKGQTVNIDLGGEAQLTIELLDDAPMREKRWSARVNLLNGGIMATVDEFPSEAPQAGYQPSTTINYDAPRPQALKPYQGSVFYFKSGQNYGRLEVTMIPGQPWIYVKSYLNPTPGSRNLEYNPAKKVP